MDEEISRFRAELKLRAARDMCRRFLIFHHVPDATAQPGYDGLVRSTDLTYSSSRAGLADTRYSLLRSATQTGYRPVPGGYQRRSLPPVEFEYSGSFGPQAVQDVDQQVSPAGLLERGRERVHELVRELADEADRIGQKMWSAADAQHACCGIERVEEAIGHPDFGPGERVD